MEAFDDNEVQPFVHEDESEVSLHFDICSVQSRMRRADPFALALDYTRTMMACLLFCPRPATMLMIGLGGGSLPKYCYRTLAQADITVVEINRHVIAMRETFHVPRDDARFRVVHGDGAAFVHRPPRRYDVILVDGFTWEGQAESLCTPEFYEDCRAALSDGGVLVANLHADGEPCQRITERIAQAFDGELVVVTAAEGGNRVAFAGSARVISCPDAALRHRLNTLAACHRWTLRDSVERVFGAVARLGA